ncbi:hypothetical protein BZA70DRAFT_310305 [Myxozyma melibiosi]|uniref:Uncharacterized protein n=1 Tax=Myxozyma melibiosi TaxID=54550 RepID=A0ABR1F7K2_9ASCO
MPRLKLPPARIISLDAYGTIYIPSPSVSEQYSNLYNDYRSRLLRHDIDSNNSAPPELSAAQINLNFKKAYKARAASHPNYAGGETEWWIAVIKDTFGFCPSTTVEEDDGGTDRFAREVYENFNSSKAYAVYPDIIPFLSTLLRNNSPPKIGVISNSDSRSRTILRGLGILSPPPPLEQNQKGEDARYLIANDNDVILSAEIGFDKPDPRIFKAAESKLLPAAAAAAAAAAAPSAKQQAAQTDDDAIAVARGLAYWHIGDEYDKDIAPLLSTPDLRTWGGIFISRLPSPSPSSSMDKPESDEERKVTLSAGGRVLTVSDLRDLSALWGSTGVDVVIAE